MIFWTYGDPQPSPEFVERVQARLDIESAKLRELYRDENGQIEVKPSVYIVEEEERDPSRWTGCLSVLVIVVIMAVIFYPFFVKLVR